ncbi:MAG TPA: YihY/virulence factor BrkB family protein [Acidobacteriota bacterium]|mgnify:CR=1 FL=1|nr:YihY/virulence factor BrkB family protein [Acidobacteriota bacterium]HRV08546.1 YihY/virulence factor BrkB family protein [Acidobacteriota bacterium]
MTSQPPLPTWSYLRRGRFWWAVWNEINQDDCWGMAAQLSYYFLMAFFPFVLFVNSLLGFLPQTPDLLSLMLRDLARVLPEDSFQLVENILRAVVGGRHGGVLTVSLVMALWFASTAFNGMIALFNRAFRVRDHRPYYITRFIAILVTIVVSVFTLFAGILLFFGDWAIDHWVQNPWLNQIYTGFRWVLIFVFLNIGVQMIFHFLPAVRLPWRYFSPGGVVAVAGWVVGSLCFRFYVNHYADYRVLWGPLGALIALMVWFYISSFTLLLGAEIDSEIHKRNGMSQVMSTAEGAVSVQAG